MTIPHSALLQRGRTQTSAESFAPQDIPQHQVNASTGPHSNECGKSSGDVTWLHVRGIASTGPHSNECGKCLTSGPVSPIAMGFNGAALKRVRKAPCRQTPTARTPRFNGAALKRVRKARDQVRRLRSRFEASTGPHSNECGKASLRQQAEQSLKALQRGRTQTSAESAGKHAQLRPQRVASTGPHSNECGKYGGGQAPARQDGASTGPHSNECGKQLVIGQIHTEA